MHTHQPRRSPRQRGADHAGEYQSAAGHLQLPMGGAHCDVCLPRLVCMHRAEGPRQGSRIRKGKKKKKNSSSRPVQRCNDATLQRCKQRHEQTAHEPSSQHGGVALLPKWNSGGGVSTTALRPHSSAIRRHQYNDVAADGRLVLARYSAFLSCC